MVVFPPHDQIDTLAIRPSVLSTLTVGQIYSETCCPPVVGMSTNTIHIRARQAPGAMGGVAADHCIPLFSVCSCWRHSSPCSARCERIRSPPFMATLPTHSQSRAANNSANCPPIAPNAVVIHRPLPRASSTLQRRGSHHVWPTRSTAPVHAQPLPCSRQHPMSRLLRPSHPIVLCHELRER
jgi:hypothetical protein